MSGFLGHYRFLNDFQPGIFKNPLHYYLLYHWPPFTTVSSIIGYITTQETFLQNVPEARGQYQPLQCKGKSARGWGPKPTCWRIFKDKNMLEDGGRSSKFQIMYIFLGQGLCISPVIPENMERGQGLSTAEIPRLGWSYCSYIAVP